MLPINAPLEYWNDSVQSAIFVAFSLRYLIVLNVAWLVNSAHFIWGLDKRYKPSDSNMIFLVTKTNWPQYHYLLPWDYQTGEFGSYGELLPFPILLLHTYKDFKSLEKHKIYRNEVLKVVYFLESLGTNEGNECYRSLQI